MQKIEKALKNVFDSIGDDYDYPEGEFLADDFGMGNAVSNPFFGQTPTPVKFMFGTQKELNAWLKDNNDKYPLVWLVYPVSESYTNDTSDFYSYKSARLIFAINNEAEKLVQTRLQTTKFVLNQLVDKFKSLMRNSSFRKYISIDKQAEVKETFYPNYSTNAQKDGGTVEIWDAITFDCDFHLIPSCIKLIFN